LTELDKPFTSYVTYYQSYACLANNHHQYLKLICYYRKNTGLGLACQTIHQVSYLLSIFWQPGLPFQTI
jgi:hypothetical protein